MGEMMRELKRYHMLFLHELALFGKREEKSSAWLFWGRRFSGLHMCLRRRMGGLSNSAVVMTRKWRDDELTSI